MGFVISMYLVRNKQSSEVLSHLGYQATGGTEDFPDSPVVCAETKNGDTLLYVNDRNVSPELLDRSLLPHGHVLKCSVNETVMFSQLTCFENNREQWSVTHDSSAGLTHLESTGQPPPPFEDLVKAKLKATAAEPDPADHVFDVPVDLFAALGGMRYDEDLDSDQEEPWAVLQPVKSKRFRWPFS